MKNIQEWIVIKALNKHEELLVKLEDNKFYVTTGVYDRNKVLDIKESISIVIDNSEDLTKLLSIIETVMTKKDNKIRLYSGMKNQDISLNLIKYNSAFKLRETLKLTLYYYVGVNSSTYNCITISKDSCKNLYKAILIARDKIGGK